jgi:hypothetical protein
MTKNPNITTLIVSAGKKDAKKRIIGVKYHLTKNPDFMEEYGDDWKPEFREAVWSSDMITIAKRTKGALREATIETTSVGIDSTGAHFDLIICDDIVNDKNTATKENRDLVHSFMKKLLMQLNPGGSLVVIGTRWHVDDAYGRIQKEDEDLVKEGKAPRFKYFIKSCWDGRQGLFFPEKLTFEFLDYQKHDQGPRMFAANYENKPVADEDRVFDISNVHIEDFDLYHINGQNVVRDRDGNQWPVNTTLAWDPAGINPTQRSDDHGVTIVGTDYADRWWVLVATGFKAPTASQILERLCSLIAFYKPSKLIIECVGGYALWIPQLERAMKEKGLHALIEEDKVGGQSKSVRIQMLEPRIRGGRLYAKPDQKKLIAQITDFSSANEMVHEDILDSLAKHEGRTRPAGQRIYEKIEFFEKDTHYAEYKKRHNLKENTNNAGHHGVNWKF